MKTADLYIRVSTDEQADKGYSQRSQEEHLRKYCEINSIYIRKIIIEDFSAKTFLRPAWQKYMQEIRNRKSSDLLLFLKWDRFSRNAGDAYEMIKMLRMRGIEPQAIEQPLDLSIPENKMMLAFYLAAPEVENDRRALNVINGMRRAMKEGRYMCTAPFGYLNKTKEDGRKYIAIHEPAAEMVRWIYRKVAEDVFNTEQIFKQAKQQGFDMTRSAFWHILRNPTYLGKIKIRKYKDEEKQLVRGLHEPIIHETLFYEVQNVLNGRKRGMYATKIYSDDRFPLRGFLICPNCNRLLTASASKGRGQYYAYYHCSVECRTRFKKNIVEEYFHRELKKFSVKPDMHEVYQIILRDCWKSQTRHSREHRKNLTDEIKNIEAKLSHIRDLLLAREIDASDFRIMKAELSTKLEELESRLADSGDKRISIEFLLRKGIQSLFDLDLVYTESTIEKKRELIGSIFPDKMIFDGNNLRIGRVNEAAQLIFFINSSFGKEKTTTASLKIAPKTLDVSNQNLSHLFVEDLQKLATLSDKT